MKLRRSIYSHPKPFSEDSSAPRRRSTPAERPSSCRRDAISRWKAASPPSLHGLPSAAGAVHKNTVGRPSARSLGVVAQEVRMPAAPSSACPRPRPASGVRCPVRATSVHACLSTGPMSSVRCGRLSVQVSAVRRPVSASGVGVRCLCVAASAVSGRSEVLERGGGAGSRTAGMAGVGVVARCVHAWLVVCLSRSLVLEAGAGGAGPAEASVWTWPSSWEVVGQWPARPRGRPGEAGCTRGSFVGGSRCAARLAFCGRLIGMGRADRSAGLAGLRPTSRSQWDTSR